MVRLLLALIIVALLVSMVSRMNNLQESRTTERVEEAIGEEYDNGLPLDPYPRAQQFSDEFPDELDEKRKRLDEQIDG
ncbi:MAG: hypothetical protein R3212_02570 [Xanthomonadales bacterium]|nr:hypothetical protein [Xanthomonadales bacterium]